MLKKWGGGLHFSPNFLGGVDEVGYFWGEVKIFSHGLGGGNICFSRILSMGGGLFLEKNWRAVRALVNILTKFH